MCFGPSETHIPSEIRRGSAVCYSAKVSVPYAAQQKDDNSLYHTICIIIGLELVSEHHNDFNNSVYFTTYKQYRKWAGSLCIREEFHIEQMSSFPLTFLLFVLHKASITRIEADDKITEAI